MINCSGKAYIDIEEYVRSEFLVKNNIYFLPSLHGSLEFGMAAKKIIDSIQFDAVALELPDFMKKQYCEGLERLPYISAVCVEAAGSLIYHLIEPQDAMSVAGRAFLKNGRQPDIHFVDRFIDDYRPHSDAFPDSYSIYGAGLVNYCSRYYSACEGLALNAREHEDLMREQYMAAGLQALAAKHSKILFVCGLYHYPAIFRMLDYDNAIPFYNKKIGRVYLANLAGSSHESVLSEMPFAIKHFERLNDPPPLSGEASCGVEPSENKTPDNILKVDFTAKDSLILNGSAADEHGARPSKAGPAVEKSKITESEYEFKRNELEGIFNLDSTQKLDRATLNLKLLKLAAVRHQKNSDAEISPVYFNTMLKFLSNYIKIKGMLAARLYDLIMAARSCVDDNYAYEAFEEAVEYPWMDDSHKFVTLELGLNDMKIDGKLVRFHRKLKSVKQMFAPYLKKRKKEERPGEWLREWNENEDSICSYPPEDIIIENFGNYLRKKAKAVLNDEQSRIEPFSTSLMDGVDMRETIRNYHVDGRIYVRIGRNVHGAAGCVVMIFDEDSQPGGGREKYPYKMTWLGEHGQESDMAFYSSVPGDKIVGPGISRCEYGGFLLSYPPMRLYDVWHDGSYFAAKSKPETLLLAALDYSLEK
ncbi:MAG TPA: hypothetical protein PK467_13110, partial [Candidatus Wallbacteria bacterium]|nr:hypothetical protein [Candidatus Wallbacteria bacterium]